jgi:hypothetical protein
VDVAVREPGTGFYVALVAITVVGSLALLWLAQEG